VRAFFSVNLSCGIVGAVMCQGTLHTHSAMCRLSYGLSQGVTVWLSYKQSHVFSYALTGVRAFCFLECVVRDGWACGIIGHATHALSCKLP